MDKSLLNQVQSDEREQDDIALAKNGMNMKNVKLKVLQFFPALALIMKRTKVVDTGASTPGGIAATDGAEIKFNASFMAGESEDEQAGTYFHELEHINRGDTNKEWSKELNEATDAVINEKARNSGFALKGGINIPNAIQIGSKKLYEILVSLRSFVRKDAESIQVADSRQSQRAELKNEQEQFTEENLQQAIFGDHDMWTRAMKYLEHKKTQVKSDFSKFANALQDKQKDDLTDNNMVLA